MSLSQEKTLPLQQWIPRLSPAYQSPKHLTPLTEAIERALHGPVRAVIHAPPRHAKTETILHAVPWFLRQRPSWTIGYASYSEKIAISKSRIARRLTERAGIKLDSDLVTEWRTAEGGGFLPAGVDGAFTGFGINVLFVDDAVKNRAEAESASRRETLVEWLRAVARTRMEPGGSIFVNMTRWHTDDLSAFCIRELGWPYIRLAAVNDDGTPLWPERWPMAELDGIQHDVGEYVWSSLYQGNPRPRGGSVFGDPYVYENTPSRYRVAIGVDLAYSKKTSADYSVAVVMAECDGLFYVLDVVRRQVQAPDFLIELYRLWAQYPSARFRWYAAGVEKGAADLITELYEHPKVRQVLPEGMRGRRLPMLAEAPRGDKFTRAIPYAARWNAHDVQMPRDAAWLDPFIAEHLNFTGVNDKRDDQVDAAVAAFDELALPSPSYDGWTKMEVRSG